MVLIAVALTVAAAGCAHRTCYTEPHVAFEKIKRSMHLPPGTGVAAELDTGDDVQESKPGLFANVPAGCYWLIETQQNTQFGQRRGVYLYNAENGREVGGESNLIKVDKF